MIGPLPLILLIAAAGVLGWIWGRKTGVMSDTRLTGKQGSDTDGPESQSDLALILLDIEDLRGVNAATDFDTGDRLVQGVRDTLDRGLPRGASLVRLQGATFLIRMTGRDLKGATDQAERLRRAAAQTVVEVDGQRIARPISAGLVLRSGDEDEARALLRAEMALTRAKEAGGNRTCALTDLAAPTVTAQKTDMEQAVATRALEFYVQPIFDLQSRRPAGVEGLLRWNRPDGQVVGPGTFIDTLNRIPDAGAELFPAMAVDAATPFVTGPHPAYVTLNVTGSLLDGEDSASARWLMEVLDRLPPEHLVMEIVESAVLVNPERSRKLIERLRARGLRIALDDFGTALSNLDRLLDLPVDFVKIDRAFTHDLGRNPKCEAIVAALADLTTRLDMTLIAEGIETEAQVQTLQRLGVHQGQGFYLGHPAPACDWAERMAALAHR